MNEVTPKHMHESLKIFHIYVNSPLKLAFAKCKSFCVRRTSPGLSDY